jgi:hypothetical protein
MPAPWSPITAKNTSITAIKTAEPALATKNFETGWARLQVYDPVNFPPGNTDDYYYLAWNWAQH